jgi:hypothetical protein
MIWISTSEAALCVRKSILMYINDDGCREGEITWSDL